MAQPQSGICSAVGSADWGRTICIRPGEYTIWTDGLTYLCVQDTNFSPAEYPQAWETVE